MSVTESFALLRLSRQRNPSGRLLFGVTLLCAAAAPARAQRLPLPEAEQDAVNVAITRGVDYLKRTRQNSGTWAKKGANYPLGYALLPGLTLMECGVPPSDATIQQVAKFLRARALRIDRTYDLSLAILFLDRLGDPKDKKLIQMFALRLIAGQSTTGGWGYKCPILSGPVQMELLAALRHLEPGPGELPQIARNPGKMPGVARGPGNKPDDRSSIAREPGRPPLEGLTGQPGASSLSGSASRGISEDSPSLSPPEGSAAEPNRERRDPESPYTDSKEPTGQKDRPPKRERPAKPERPKSNKPYVMPERIRLFPVVQNPDLHILQDPQKKANDLIVTTTDNSNTQFAILALWAAQRYDVPMKRTLNLVVRRFATSQNPNGTWDYHYRFVGNAQDGGQGTPSMTCAGLIGLAVGHGLAQPDLAGQLVQDPRIQKGLNALYPLVGKPSEDANNPSMQNLYFLWSVERVAVLYDLPVIGDKDWYRWGAQVLVAHQQAQGNWAEGQYHGNSPTIDTCLALLFLKRVNLVKDLTAKLPFKAADLNLGIMKSLKPPSKPSESPKSIVKSISTAELPKDEAPDKYLEKPPPSLENTASSSEEAIDRPRSSKAAWILLSVLVFMVFSGGSVFVLFVVRRRGEEVEGEKNGKAKKAKNKRKPQSKP